MSSTMNAIWVNAAAETPELLNNRNLVPSASWKRMPIGPSLVGVSPSFSV